MAETKRRTRTVTAVIAIAIIMSLTSFVMLLTAPRASATDYIFYEDFERSGTLGAWPYWNPTAKASFCTTSDYSGLKSLRLGTLGDGENANLYRWISNDTDTRNEGIVIETMMYDNAAEIALNRTDMHIDNVATTSLNIGVAAQSSTTKYSVWTSDGGAAMVYTATSIQRTTGWHNLKVVLYSHTHYLFYIDNNLVKNLTITDNTGIGYYGLFVQDTSPTSRFQLFDNFIIYRFGEYPTRVPSGFNYATVDPIPVTQEITNPVLQNWSGEYTLIYNSSMNWVDEWFASGTPIYSGSATDMYYTHSADYDRNVFIPAVKVLSNVRFVVIVKDDSTGIYYAFGHVFSGPDWTMPIYMWTSPNKVTWTMANHNKPVMYNSLVETNLYYWMANPSVVIIDGMFHMWIESGAWKNGESTWHGKNYTEATGLGYSFSKVSTGVNFTHNATQYFVIPHAGAPCALYVPDRNAAMVFYVWNWGDYLGQIKVSTVPTGRFGAAAMYEQSNSFTIGPRTLIMSDPTVVFITGPNPEMTLQFNRQQNDTFQSRINMTLDGFFDALNTGTSTGQLHLPVEVHPYVTLIMIFMALILVMPVIGLAKEARSKGIDKNQIIELVIFEVIGIILYGVLVILLGS